MGVLLKYPSTEPTPKQKSNNLFLVGFFIVIAIAAWAFVQKVIL